MDHIPTRQLIRAGRLGLTRATSVQAAALFKKARIVSSTVNGAIHCGQLVNLPPPPPSSVGLAALTIASISTAVSVRHLHLVMSLHVNVTRRTHSAVPSFAQERPYARAWAALPPPRPWEAGGAWWRRGLVPGNYGITPMQRATALLLVVLPCDECAVPADLCAAGCAPAVCHVEAYVQVTYAVGMGAVMGSLVGLTIGFIGGGFQILRYVRRLAHNLAAVLVPAASWVRWPSICSRPQPRLAFSCRLAR